MYTKTISNINVNRIGSNVNNVCAHSDEACNNQSNLNTREWDGGVFRTERPQFSRVTSADDALHLNSTHTHMLDQHKAAPPI